MGGALEVINIHGRLLVGFAHTSGVNYGALGVLTALLGGLLFAAVEVLSFKLQLMAENVPYQLFLMLPFITVVLIMMIFKKNIEFPASVGKPYSRE